MEATDYDSDESYKSKEGNEQQNTPNDGNSQLDSDELRSEDVPLFENGHALKINQAAHESTIVPGADSLKEYSKEQNNAESLIHQEKNQEHTVTDGKQTDHSDSMTISKSNTTPVQPSETELPPKEKSDEEKVGVQDTNTNLKQLSEDNVSDTHISTNSPNEKHGPHSNESQSSQSKLSVIGITSDEESVTNGKTSDVVEIDDNSDLEITGESLLPVPLPAEKPTHRTPPKRPGKDTPFKTNLQCVYHMGMYTCKTCFERSKSYVEFGRHVFQHLHDPNGKDGHDCPYCVYPINEDCIENPLACPLVTQLMGMLQKQKKAQDWSKPLSESAPDVCTSSRNIQPMNQKDQSQSVYPRSCFSNKHLSTELSTNGQGGDYNRTFSRIDEDALPIKPIIIEPEDPTSNNQGNSSDISVTESSDRNVITTEATGREGSPRPSSSTNLSDDTLQIDLGSGNHGISGDGRSSLDEPPSSPIPPWTIDGNPAAIRIRRSSRGPKGPASVVSCYHVGNTFQCARCDYSVQDTKPKVFRRHLWFEVHPSKTCDHCPDSVKYNRFMSCPVINELLTYLLEVKAKKDYETTHEITTGDTQDNTNSSKYKPRHAGLISDVDSDGSALVDIVNEDDSSCGSYTKKAGVSSAPSESSQGQKTRSSTVVSPIPTPTDVIAMIQGLNDQNMVVDSPKAANEIIAPTPTIVQDTALKPTEPETESMFVITSVVSQASEVAEDEKLMESAAKSTPLDDTEENMEQDKEPMYEGKNNEDEISEEENTEFNCDSSEKDESCSQFDCENVSRTLPYTWDKSRKSTKPLPQVTLPGIANYTCGFYKCSFWASTDTEGFRIHNLINHKHAERFCCAFCVQMFQSDEVLMKHQDNEHTASRLFIKFRSYYCGIKDCSWASTNQGEFVCHNEILHPEVHSYPCSFCKKAMSSVSKLVNHINESVRYSCTLCPCREPTYEDIVKHVSSQHAPMEVDNFIKLQLICVCNVDPDGDCQYKSINRCINRHNKPMPETATEEFQETFKCTNCGLLTGDEEYFETHVIECMKNPPLKTTQHTTKTSSNKSVQKVLQSRDDDNNDNSKDIDSSGELSPLLANRNLPRVKKKGVLQRLGKGLPVVCGKCSFKTEFRVVKAIHERIHLYSQDETNMFWCPHCPYSTNFVLHLKIHIQGHSEKSRIRLYICSHCSYSSSQVDMVEDHHEDVHGDLELKSEVTRLVVIELKCPDCATIIKTEEELLEHLEKQHSTDSVQNYLKEMYAIASLQIMDDEIQEEDEISPQRISEQSAMSHQINEVDEDLQQGADRFQCPNCNYSAYKCGTWVRHIQRHNISANQEIVLYCCKTCKWKSTSKRKTIDHCKMKHNEIILEVQTMEFSALQISESEENVDDIPDHFDETSGITKYHCDFCDFSTNDRDTLTEHWTLHEGETASAYEQAKEYKEHKEPRPEEPTQQIGMYNRTNQSSDTVINENHLRLLDEAFARLQNNEGKPCKEAIQCPICPYTTELRKCLRRHLIFHKTQSQMKNGFKCAYCPYMSEREGVVTRHMSVYHRDLPSTKIIIGHPKLRDEDQFSRDKPQASPSVPRQSYNKHTAPGTQYFNPADREDKVYRSSRHCPKCDYSTKLQYNLLHHMKWHSKEPIEIGDEENESGLTISAVTGSGGTLDMGGDEGSNQNTRNESQPEPNSGDTYGSDDEYCRSLFCTPVPGKDLFKCKSCLFMARDPAKIYLHFCTGHQDECPFQCGYCEFRSIAVIKIQQHCHIIHNNLPVRISPVVDDKAANGATTQELGYRTVTADLIEDESTLDDEQREQAYDDWLSSFMIKCGNNVQMCNICGYEQKGQAALKRHVLAVHLRYYPYKCKHCAFSAVEANKILKHIDKNHPSMERKIIRRKIPDDLPSVIDCEKEALNEAAAKESRENVIGTPTAEKTDNQNLMSIKIKEEPRSDLETEDVYGGVTDDDLTDSNTNRGASEVSETMHIKTERKDPRDELEEMYGTPSGIQTPVTLSRRQKYPKQYTKTYRCTECNYMSKWNLADVKHHVLTVHLKIHPYSCRYCCFGSPRRGRLMEHYDSQHPGLPISADQAREEIQSALSVFEDGDAVFIGLNHRSGEIESKYLPNVKLRNPKVSGANVGGRQRGSSSSRHSSPAPGPSSPSLTSSPSPAKSASRIHDGRTPDLPLDLSFRTTPPLSTYRSGLVPGINTQVLKVPSTLRVPTITTPYTPDSPAEQDHSSSSTLPLRIKRRPKKREYTLYKCSSCGRGYVQKIKAQYHFALKHLNLNPYICNYCSFGEDARKRVIEHIIAKHPGQELIVFPAFREHALVQEKVLQIQVDVSEYEGAMRSVKFINDSGILQNREKVEKRTIRCPQCSLMLPNMEELDRHMASTHKDYTGFKCSYCGAYVKGKQKMKYHLTAKHPRLEPMYQPIKEGVPYGNALSTFDEIVRKKPQFLGQGKQIIISNPNALTVAFPFYRPKQEKIGFANISKKRLSARCSRGYRENTGNLVEDMNLQMRVPTQPTPDESTVDGRPPPKMIKPRSDVVGGTVWLLCNHCTYTTLTSTLMRHHVMSHINYRPFRCSYCSFNGVRSHQVKKHMLSMHRKLPPVVKYRTDPNVEHTLTDHFTMKVRRGNMERSLKPFWNKNLPSHTSVKSKWNANKSHLDNPLAVKRLKIEQVTDIEHTAEVKNDEPMESKEPVGENDVRRQELYVCVLCGFKRPSRSSLLRHIMWELDYRPWSCPHCEYKDVTLVGVKRHCFQAHQDMPFKMLLKQDPERMSKIQAMVEQSKQPTVPKPIQNSTGTVIKQEPIDSTEGPNSLSSTYTGYSYNQPGTRENVYEAGMMMAVPSDNTVVTSAEQLEAQEEQQYSRDTHIFQCKHCTFQSPDKTCFKKHILRHGPKRFQCGYCSYCAVFKAELHKHMNRLHKRKPYKIITLADNQIVTTKVKTLTNRLKHIPTFSHNESGIPLPGLVPTLGARVAMPSTLSVDPIAEGGMLAQLEAELEEMVSEGGPDAVATDSPRTATKRKIKEENDDSLVFAVLDGVVLTREHLSMNAAGEYRCGFCDLTSTNREKSRTHLAKHFQLRWKCAHCSMKHQLSYEMRRHIRARHPGYPLKMVRLETTGDFASLPNRRKLTESPTSSSGKSEEVLIATPMIPYNRPGPACSKKNRPNPARSSIPTVFCCFLCTFKTHSTTDLIEHQKKHAVEAEESQEDGMPILSPAVELPKESTESESINGDEVDEAGEGSDGSKSATEKRSRPVCYASDSELDLADRQNFVRPFKCGHCDFSGFVRAKVKNHCIRVHKDLPVLVLEQQRKEASYKKSFTEHMQMPQLTSASATDVPHMDSYDDMPRLFGTALSVVTDNVLSIPEIELEKLLKQNDIKSVLW